MLSKNSLVGELLSLPPQPLWPKKDDYLVLFNMVKIMIKNITLKDHRQIQKKNRGKKNPNYIISNCCFFLALREKRSTVVAQLKQLQSETEPIVKMFEDPETTRQMQSTRSDQLVKQIQILFLYAGTI